MKISKKKIKQIVFISAIVLIGIGIFGFLIKAYQKVQAGHGLDYYISGKGYQFNYIAALSVFLTIPVSMIFAWFIRIYLNNRDERVKRQQIEERFAKNKALKKRKRRT